MAHYAYLNSDNEVISVIVGKNENEETPEGFDSWEDYYLSKESNAVSCKRTSYNTHANQHLNGGTPFRGNFASVGMIYDETNDVFHDSSGPFSSWSLNNQTFIYDPPVDYPSDANGGSNPDTSLPMKVYEWNETDNQWDLIRTYTYNGQTLEWELDD